MPPPLPTPYWTVPKMIVAGALVFALVGAAVVIYPIVQRAVYGMDGSRVEVQDDPCRKQTDERGVAIFCNPGDIAHPTSTKGASSGQTAPRKPSEPKGTLADW